MLSFACWVQNPVTCSLRRRAPRFLTVRILSTRIGHAATGAFGLAGRASCRGLPCAAGSLLPMLRTLEVSSFGLSKCLGSRIRRAAGVSAFASGAMPVVASASKQVLRIHSFIDASTEVARSKPSASRLTKLRTVPAYRAIMSLIRVAQVNETELVSDITLRALQKDSRLQARSENKAQARAKARSAPGHGRLAIECLMVRAKSGETLVEARSDTDVQIVCQNCL